MTPEGRIEKHLKKEVEASGGKVRKLKWIGKNGAPDRIIWWPALRTASGGRPAPRMAFVELKAPGKKPTKVQEIEHAALRDDGFQVFVIDSIEAASAIVNRLRKPEDWPVKTAKASFDHVDLKSPPNLPVTQCVKAIIPDNNDLI